MITLEQFLTMTTSAALGFLVGFLIQRHARIQRSKKSRSALIHNMHSEVRLVLLESVYKTDAANALLLHMHNGGPELSAGVRIYSSVLDEAPEDSALSVMKVWQRYEVDRDYREMMQRMRQDGFIVLCTKDMPEGVLRRRYESMGVTCSVVFWLLETTGGPYYLSFPTRADDCNDYIGGSDFSHLEGCANQIRNILRRYQKESVLH